MKLKSGVRVQGIRPELILAIVIADGVWRDDAGAEMVVTSVTDGRHSRGSLHYTGAAFDIRTRDLVPDTVPDLAERLRKALGEDYDVVLEATHIHVEYQPKRPYGEVWS
jgi:hypothetical protein